jgi:hypothetical protein
MIRQKQPLQISIWLELLLITAVGVMSGVEATHAQWLWAIIFGTAGIAFGISIALRITAENKHDKR